jgi:hypothetical protein
LIGIFGSGFPKGLYIDPVTIAVNNIGVGWTMIGDSDITPYTGLHWNLGGV